MKKLCLYLTAAILLAGCGGADHLKKADVAYESLAYVKAIEQYEIGLKNKNNPVAAARLADSYRLTGNHEMAEKWYAAASADPSATPETRLRYARELLANGKADLARKQASLLLDSNPGSEQARRVVEACDTRTKLQEAREGYTVAPAAFNSPDAADFCPAFQGKAVVFTSDRKGDAKSKWTGRSFTALYNANSGEPLKGEVNGKYNDGAACFSSDGRTMYFTRNNYKGSTRKKGKSDVVNLIIARARLEGDTWVYEDFFPFNSPDFSSAHPALSPDGRVLVFASDRPGGLGGMDLWKTEFNGSNWSTPENLGPKVNSEGDEVFPSWSSGSMLLYASHLHTYI